jgi:hypothetical protein
MRFPSLLTASLTALVALSSASWSEEKAGEQKAHDETGRTITADQLPPAVKATLDQQVAGAKVLKYEQETRDGKTVFTAEVKGKEKGQLVEYVVSEDGKLIATDLENEEGEKKADGEKKHHHKKKDS